MGWQLPASMLSRIKEIVSGSEAKELASQLALQLKQVAESVREQNELIGSLRKDTDSARASVAELAHEVKTAINSARELQEAIRADIAELKTLSSHLQGSIKQQISDDMAELARQASAKLEGAEKLKHEVAAAAASVTNELNKLKSDLAKLSAVADKIKVEDFELTKFSSQVLAADKEKLQLMGRIDALERLIAKMRRQQ